MDYVLVPVQADYLAAEDMTELVGTVQSIKRQINPRLKIGGAFLTMANETNFRKDIVANNDYREVLTRAGLALTGLSPDGKLVEIVELPDHPWFVSVQFHPELKSRPNRAHPLFREFIRAAKKQIDD